MKTTVTLSGAQTLALQSALFAAVDSLKHERDETPRALPHVRDRLQRQRDALGALCDRVIAAHVRAQLRNPWTGQSAKSRAGKVWAREEDAYLRACWGTLRRQSGSADETVRKMARTLKRSPVAVAARLQATGVWH